MTSMEPDSLGFLTLINKVQSHSDGVLAGLRCLCFQDTREGMVKVLVKVIRPESKKKNRFLEKNTQFNKSMVSSHWNFFKSLLGPSIAGFSYTS